MDEQRPDEPSTLPRAPASGTTDPPVVDLDEEAVRPRSSARLRAVPGGVVLLVVLAVVGLLLHGIAPVQRQGTSAVLPFTPPTVLIESNVSFGTLSLNGQALHGSPPLLTSRVHPGPNVVTLAAPPFAPKTCHFLFPSDHPSAETGCTGGGTEGGPIAIQGVSVVPDQILDIELGSAGLPPSLAARASATVLQAIAAVPLRTVVPVGQYYATGQDAAGHISAQLASAPLQAQTLFGLAMCGPSPFCPSPLAPGLAFAPGQRVWSVGLNLTANWDFTPPAGPAVLSPPVQIGFPLQLFLAYDRTGGTGGTDGAGGWRVVSVPQAAPPPHPGTMAALADQLPFALCQAGSSLLSGLLPSPSAYGFDTPYYRGIGGCMIQVVRAASSAVQGTFLWRFGVLLAVDTGAYRLVPGLPIAPQAEVAAVAGCAGQCGQPATAGTTPARTAGPPCPDAYAQPARAPCSGPGAGARLPGRSGHHLRYQPSRMQPTRAQGRPERLRLFPQRHWVRGIHMPQRLLGDGALRTQGQALLAALESVFSGQLLSPVCA